jgi:hypothetical protein
MKPVLEPYVTRLEDGLWVQIRPLGPDDREALKEGLTHVGNRSLYERFLSQPQADREGDRVPHAPRSA